MASKWTADDWADFEAELAERFHWTPEEIAEWKAEGFRARSSQGGDDADIEANYPGGLAAFRRNREAGSSEPALETAVEDGQIVGASPID